MLAIVLLKVTCWTASSPLYIKNIDLFLLLKQFFLTDLRNSFFISAETQINKNVINEIPSMLLDIFPLNSTQKHIYVSSIFIADKKYLVPFYF